MAGSSTIPQNSLESLFVSDLHPLVSDLMLLDTFAPFGTVLSAQVFKDPATDRSLGTGYVQFSNEAEAEEAMDSLMFKRFFGTPMRIMWDKLHPSHSSLYVKNLAVDVDNASLRKIFSNFGEIVSCQVASDPSGLKNYGFVHFKSMTAAKIAIRYVDGMHIKGKNVSVTLYKSYAECQATQKIKTSEIQPFLQAESETEETETEETESPPRSHFWNLPYYFISQKIIKLFFLLLLSYFIISITFVGYVPTTNYLVAKRATLTTNWNGLDWKPGYLTGLPVVTDLSFTRAQTVGQACICTCPECVCPSIISNFQISPDDMYLFIRWLQRTTQLDVMELLHKRVYATLQPSPWGDVPEPQELEHRSLILSARQPGQCLAIQKISQNSLWGTKEIAFAVVVGGSVTWYVVNNCV